MENVQNILKLAVQLSEIISPEETKEILSDKRNSFFSAVKEKLERKKWPDSHWFVSEIVVVPTNDDTFIARQKFVKNSECNGKVRIRHIGENFEKWFLSGDGKVECPFVEQTLHCNDVRHAFVDPGMMLAHDGYENMETSLSLMFSFLEKQMQGEEGLLLITSEPNFFVVKDTDNNLRMVVIRWRSLGWTLNAFAWNDPDKFANGGRVFSQKRIDTPPPLARA